MTMMKYALVLALLGLQDRGLGPAEGRDLPASDLERVRVGALAPDFTLPDMDGKRVTLSQFRGHKKVVLVFYRGYW